MAYSTIADMVARVSAERIIRLVDDERLEPENIDESDPASAAMVERVQKVIAEADDKINAYIGRQYKLPLASVPPLVNKMSTDIAFYLLLARYNPAIEESWQLIYKDWLALLMRIADSKAVLDADTVPEAEKEAAAGEFVSGEERIFSRTSLNQW